MLFGCVFVCLRVVFFLFFLLLDKYCFCSGDGGDDDDDDIEDIDNDDVRDSVIIESSSMSFFNKVIKSHV